MSLGTNVSRVSSGRARSGVGQSPQELDNLVHTESAADERISESSMRYWSTTQFIYRLAVSSADLLFATKAATYEKPYTMRK